jgi:hypothetical protein
MMKIEIRPAPETRHRTAARGLLCVKDECITAAAAKECLAPAGQDENQRTDPNRLRNSYPGSPSVKEVELAFCRSARRAEFAESPRAGRGRECELRKKPANQAAQPHMWAPALFARALGEGTTQAIRRLRISSLLAARDPKMISADPDCPRRSCSLRD